MGLFVLPPELDSSEEDLIATAIENIKLYLEQEECGYDYLLRGFAIPMLEEAKVKIISARDTSTRT